MTLSACEVSTLSQGAKIYNSDSTVYVSHDYVGAGGAAGATWTEVQIWPISQTSGQHNDKPRRVVRLGYGCADLDWKSYNQLSILHCTTDSNGDNANKTRKIRIDKTVFAVNIRKHPMCTDDYYTKTKQVNGFCPMSWNLEDK